MPSMFMFINPDKGVKMDSSGACESGAGGRIGGHNSFNDKKCHGAGAVGMPLRAPASETSSSLMSCLKRQLVMFAEDVHTSMLMKWSSFAKHEASEFPGVFVPLEKTSQKSVTARTAESRNSSSTCQDGEQDAEKPEYSPSRDDDHSEASVLTLESLRAEVEADLAAGTTNTPYDIKAKVINRAIQDIGMGRYQWQLFTLCGFGWFADNLWLQGIALTLPSLSAEFGVDENTVRYTTLSLFLGLCIGASFWGIASDVVGRRLAFNFTLLLAGVFGLASGGGPNWIGTCALYACIGLGVGGNLPVDGALFLEFLPMASGNLLTLLSVWWPVGQLVSSLLAWAFIVNFSDEWGWRYLVLTLGAITFVMSLARFFLFHLFESPKFLLSRGRQTEAVAVVHGIAYFNRSQTWLSENILNAIGGHPEDVPDQVLSTVQIIKRSLSKFSGERIGPLLRGGGWRLTASTLLIWFIWTTIGMGYPLFNAFLPQYLQRAGGGGAAQSASVAYRNYTITSVVGVPGSILAAYTVKIKYVGRKGTMAIATLLSGTFLILFTQATSDGYQLAMSSLEAFFQNIMYGVLYAYTPEVFPAPNRGTGSGIGSFLNRVAGLCAPIVAVNAGAADPSAPIYASAGLFFAAFLAMLVLPYETNGRQSL